MTRVAVSDIGGWSWIPALRFASAGMTQEDGSVAYWVYIMTSGPQGTLYVGVTRDLSRRVWEHQNGLGLDFVRRYRVTKLAWAQAFEDINEAIATEKRIKRWRRAWKIEMIRKSNPKWDDLTSTIH